MWRTKDTMLHVLDVLKSFNEIIVFDTETTGFKRDAERIIQLSGQKFRIDGENLVLIDEFDEYINPEKSIPPKITEITGITDEDVEDALTESELFESIKDFFGELPVAAYNASFDVDFMSAMYGRCGGEFHPLATLDVLEMARDFVDKSESKKHNLSTIAELYGVNEGLRFHDSKNDVIATARLLQIFYNEYLQMAEDQEARAKELAAMPKKQPKITAMHYWQGFRGLSRIYIQTDLGTFYYDIRNKVWNKKPDNPQEIDEIDMEKLRQAAFVFAGVVDEAELAGYRG